MNMVLLTAFKINVYFFNDYFADIFRILLKVPETEKEFKI
jgi:hypothetical protein